MAATTTSSSSQARSSGGETSKLVEPAEDDEAEEEPFDYDYWSWREPEAHQGEGLWDRLCSLLVEDSVAHALVFLAAVLFFLDIHWPSLLLMVLSPAFVGALLVLDYCGQVKEEVARAAFEAGLENVAVDRSLQFSSGDVQAAYHLWMDKLPGVKWHSFLSLLSMQLLIHFALALKGEEHGCNWKHQGFGVPATALLTVQTVLAYYKAPMQAQSLVGLVGVLLMKAIATAAVICKDRCVSSILDMGHKSRWMISFSAVVHTVGTHIGYRVDMQHFAVFSTATFVLMTAFAYSRYLHQRGGSDPYLSGLQLVALSSAVATEGAVIARYYVAKMNMICFLRQAQLTKQQVALHED